MTWWYAASWQSLYPPCEYEQTEITVRAGEELFTAHGNVIKTAGWKAVYENLDGGIEADSEDAGGDGSSAAGQILPDLKEGDVLQGISFAMTEKKDQTPGSLQRGHPAFCHGKSGGVYGVPG